MPTRTISPAGGNWNAVGAWVEGAVPTAADDVVATALSGSLTINVAAACRSIDLTLYAVGKVLTHAAAVTLSVGNATGGALNFSGAWTYTKGSTTTSAIAFVSTSTNGGAGWAVTTGGKVLGNVDFAGTSGVGGKWVLQDNYTANGATTTRLTVSAGTFDTTNKTLTLGQFVVTGSNARTLTLGSSAIQVSGGTGCCSAGIVTNLTVTANTAVISMTTLTGNTSPITWGGMDWNGLSFVLTGPGVPTVAMGAAGATIRNFSRIGSAVAGCTVRFAHNFTVTGNLTFTGFNPTTQRLTVNSNTVGTNRTITYYGTLTSTNADYTDITLVPVSPNATATPATVAAVAAVPAPTVSTLAVTHATATPAVAVAVAAVAAPAISTGIKATPATIAAIAAIPAAAISTGQKATPATVAAVAAVGAPTVTTGTKALPATVAAVAGIAVPTISLGQTAAPAVVAVVTTTPGPAVTTGTTAFPTTVMTVAAVPAPTVTTLTAGGQIKTFPGAATKPTKVFPGAVEKPVKFYDGVDWVLV